MREPRLYNRTWRRAGPLRRQRFFDILSEQREGGPFDSAFIDLLHKRRSSTIRFWFKLISLQFPILALLVLALIPIHASVSVLGITPAASRNLREILVVISAIFGVIASGVSIYYAVLNEMIEAYVIKLSKGNSETKEFLGIAHGVDFLIFPKSLDKNVHIGWGFGVFLLAVFAALAVLVLSIVAGFLYLHLYVLSDIYNDPSFSRKISVYVILFVLLADFVSLSINLLSGWPIAVRDYTNLQKLSKIEDKDPQKAKAVYQQMARNYVRKPWFLKIFSRAKMPRHVP